MPAVISDDALNRYRLTHPDKDIRGVTRRIHRLPRKRSSSPDGSEPKSALDVLGMYGNEEQEEEQKADAERETVLTRIEILKWKLHVERVMASAKNLGKQGERYRARAEETSRQAEALEATLEDEKRHLAAKLKERDHMIRCDAVYAKITARPKTKDELNDQIITLRAQIESHRTSYATYLEIVQKRVDAFSAIAPIVDDVKTMKLPIGAAADTAEDVIEIDDTPSNSRDEEIAPESDRKLSGMALPFQPSSSSSTILPARTVTIAPPTAPSSRATSHASLPHRPSRGSPAIPTAPSAARGAGGPVNRASSASLPQKPSALRSSVTPGRNLLEEGEVEGEEGEVDDRKGSRGGRRR